MRNLPRTVAITVLAALLAGAAAAEQTPAEAAQSPRLVGTAVLVNIVYVPLRVALTGVTAVVGGFAGFITAGNQGAANSIWKLTNGPQVVTPAMLAGTERWHLGGYD